MKKIENLVDDIYAVIAGNGGWDATITNFFSEEIKKLAETRMEQSEKRNYLSLSSVGFPCKRKLWYKSNQGDKAEDLPAETLGTFFYGDILEVLVIALAKAAGHTVEGEQDTLEVYGIKGHRDCIIDGMTVDVKSANERSMYKFRGNALRESDPFGYISQLSSYVYAGKDDPKVIDKKRGAFLVIQKEKFKLLLDVYDFSKELETKEKEIEDIKKIVQSSTIPPRLDPVPQSATSPNFKLNTTCNYCEFKVHCWPTLRTFLYSNKAEHLVKVVKEPNVTEIIR